MPAGMKTPDFETENTVASALSWARRELARAAVDSPHLTAELLLRNTLGWDRTRLLTYPEAPIPDEKRENFVTLVRRRCAGEPLEYITGEQEFFGLSFLVTPAVLIPRPETEILVEKALALAHMSSVRPLRFADVGTGSGCIAVSVARELRLWPWPARTRSDTVWRIVSISSVRTCWNVSGRVLFLISF